ncbi:hypothetical protein [Streptomyces sp. NPDC051014]|uniref:hypothetical protein n=1 Tax=Streptomyces TaxID=1883 RepID=UPI0033BFDD51
MSIVQQYFLDTCRARRHGEPVPPAPGTHDVRVARAVREHRRFRAVLAGRPARGRLRAAVLRRSRPSQAGSGRDAARCRAREAAREPRPRACDRIC